MGDQVSAVIVRFALIAAGTPLQGRVALTFRAHFDNAGCRFAVAVFTVVIVAGFGIEIELHEGHLLSSNDQPSSSLGAIFPNLRHISCPSTARPASSS